MNDIPHSQPDWPEYVRRILDSTAHEADTDRIPAPPFREQTHGGVFVTLHKFKQLRGCMGTLDPSRPLDEAVRQAAISAAFHDPRFAPLTLDELPEVDIEVSVLSTPWPVHDLDELTIGRHGVIVRRGRKQGLFLPQVATDHHLDKETFLSRCSSEKAGLPADAWRESDTQVLLFTTQASG